MDLSDIKLFLAVARVGNFSKAGGLQGISQSAASTRIFQLALGQRLFSRYDRGATLTQAGQLLVPQAQKLVRDLGHRPKRLRGALSKTAGVARTARPSTHIAKPQAPMPETQPDRPSRAPSTLSHRSPMHLRRPWLMSRAVQAHPCSA